MTKMICPRCGEPEFQRFGDHLRCDLCEFSLKDIGFSCPACGRKTTTTFVVTEDEKYRICCARCALANRLGGEDSGTNRKSSD